jgi:hypothetical protein
METKFEGKELYALDMDVTRPDECFVSRRQGCKGIDRRHISHGKQKVQKQVRLYVSHCCSARGSIVVEVLCYKLEGRGFETR